MTDEKEKVKVQFDDTANPREPCPKCGSKEFRSYENATVEQHYSVETNDWNSTGEIVDFPTEHPEADWYCDGCNREVEPIYGDVKK